MLGTTAEKNKFRIYFPKHFSEEKFILTKIYNRGHPYVSLHGNVSGLDSIL